jgi:hypothetical protein
MPGTVARPEIQTSWIGNELVDVSNPTRHIEVESLARLFGCHLLEHVLLWTYNSDLWMLTRTTNAHSRFSVPSGRSLRPDKANTSRNVELAGANRTV